MVCSAPVRVSLAPVRVSSAPVTFLGYCPRIKVVRDRKTLGLFCGHGLEAVCDRFEWEQRAQYAVHTCHRGLQYTFPVFYWRSTYCNTYWRSVHVQYAYTAYFGSEKAPYTLSAPKRHGRRVYYEANTGAWVRNRSLGDWIHIVSSNCAQFLVGNSLWLVSYSRPQISLLTPRLRLYGTTSNQRPALNI